MDGGHSAVRGVGEEGFEDANTHNAQTKSSPPQSYIDVHGALQTSPGCEAGSMTVRDSVRLRVRIRAPTNVHGLGFRFRFFSHEYPNYLCTKYNDFMLVLMVAVLLVVVANAHRLVVALMPAAVKFADTDPAVALMPVAVKFADTDNNGVPGGCCVG